MTAPAETADLLNDWSVLIDGVRAVFKRIGEAFQRLVRAFRPWLRIIARHCRGYSSPAPLAIDGHAYALRRRARVRRGRR